MKYDIIIPVVLTIFLFGCKKETIEFPSSLYGTWVSKTDGPGREPGDTLRFYKKDGVNVLAFYSAGTPGPAWPVETVTPVKWERNKLVFKDYTGQTMEYYDIDSFEWINENTFSLKFYELMLYISSDYRVYYEKVR